MTSTWPLEYARQLEAALRTFRQRVERDGSGVHPRLRQDEEMARFWVTTGQDGSVFDRSADSVDAAVMTPRLLTRRQVADALTMSESTVKREISAGRLPVVHVGGAVRVRATDLDEYVAGLATPASDSDTAA